MRGNTIAVGVGVGILLGVGWWLVGAGRGPDGGRERSGDGAGPRVDATGSGDGRDEAVTVPVAEAVPVAPDEGPRLLGLVIEEGGGPVAGARVTAAAEVPRGAAAVEGRTDTGGRFALVPNDPTATFSVRVEAEEYLVEVVDGVAPGAEPTLVRLQRAPALVGTVTSTAGRPIGGARVLLLARTDGGVRLEVAAVTGADGRYRLDGRLLATDRLEDPLLDVAADGFAPSRVSLRDVVQVRARGAEPGEWVRDVRLSPGSRVLGRVVDDEGAPVEGAEVVLFRHAGRGLVDDERTGATLPSRCLERARALTIELRDDEGRTSHRVAVCDVELDPERQRVTSTILAPTGRWTLVLVRGEEVLRVRAVTVLEDERTELDG